VNAVTTQLGLSRLGRRLLESSGMRFVEKAHSQMIEDNPTYSRTYNQIWVR
jgi:hypothetical protein